MKMKKILALVLAVSLVLPLCACGNTENQGTESSTITDMIGREVTVAG